MYKGKQSPSDGCCKEGKASLVVKTPTQSLSVSWQISQKHERVLNPPTSGGFLIAFPLASCVRPLPWETTPTSVSETPFCPLLSLHAYVVFPGTCTPTFEAPVPVLLVTKSVPAPGLLAGDLKHCPIPRTNKMQNWVELQPAASSHPQALAAEVPGFSLPLIKADLWTEADIPLHSSERNRHLNEGENLRRNPRLYLPKGKMLDCKHRP